MKIDKNGLMKVVPDTAYIITELTPNMPIKHDKNIDTMEVSKVRLNDFKYTLASIIFLSRNVTR
jgi:hypothetical protein